MSKSRAQIIRELAMKEDGQLFRRQIYGAFGAVTREERQAVDASIKDLVHRGVLKSIGEKGIGLYELQAKAPAPCPMRDAIWRAIRTHRTFTSDDLILATDCARETAKELIIDWRRQGLIKVSGWRKDGARNLRLYKLLRDQVVTPPRTWKRSKRAK